MKLKQIDQMEMVLDKRTFKIMRYIYRKHEASYTSLVIAVIFQNNEFIVHLR